MVLTAEGDRERQFQVNATIQRLQYSEICTSAHIDTFYTGHICR